jgi:hypothetical protein
MPEIQYGFYYWSESTDGLKGLSEENLSNYEINQRFIK